jgi:threonine/homoserine/homoserine lactone efflux protein
MLWHLLLGFALGAGSSVIPGVCGLAVIGAARTRGRRHAIALACGTALGDALYSAIGMIGIGEVFARFPAIPPVLRAMSSLTLIVYAVIALRALSRTTEPKAPQGSAARCFLVGLGLCLASPGALVTWIVLVGSALGDASLAAQLATAAGIGLGTAIWFGGVGFVVARAAGRDHTIVLKLTRLVCVLLIVYASGMLVQVLAT